MPLVRIALRRGKPAEFGKQAGAIVYRAMREAINVPDKDNFQVITEHDANGLVYDPDYLGIARSNGVIFIQITMSEGRSVALKQALYRAIADGLYTGLGVRREDVFINLVEVPKENWSFGNGVAQYVLP
jgi:phenylpyruvate tautomerase PptA (4-oxalocrotonate tautomerase family)